MKHGDALRHWSEMSCREWEDKARQFAITALGSPLLAEKGLSSDSQNELMLCGVWGVQRYRQFEPHNAISLIGFKPSRLNLGYSSLFKVTQYYRERGARIMCLVGALEALKSSTDTSVVREKVTSCTAQVANMFGPSTEFLVDMDEPGWATWKEIVSQAIKISKIRQLLGWSDDMSFSYWETAVLMVTGFMAPQLKIGKPIVTLVPCGINEAPYAELTKIVAEHLGLEVPIFFYINSLPSLTGAGRMTSAAPDVSLFMDQTVGESFTLLMKSHTGGRPSIEHKALGGQPEVCTFFKAYQKFASSVHAEDIYTGCKLGRTCKECKIVANSLQPTNLTLLEMVKGNHLDKKTPGTI